MSAHHKKETSLSSFYYFCSYLKDRRVDNTCDMLYVDSTFLKQRQGT
jgi:hypothetical protein